MSPYRRKAEGPWWVRISVAGGKIRKSSGTQDRAAAQEFEQHEKEPAWRELKLGERAAARGEKHRPLADRDEEADQGQRRDISRGLAAISTTNRYRPSTATRSRI